MAQKTVFITGAGRGIGLELARIFKNAGDRVIATSRTMTPELKSLGADETFVLDVSGNLGSLRERAPELFKTSLDILINNAGQLNEEKNFEHLDTKNVENSFHVNTMGPLRVTQTLMPWLKNSAMAIVAHVTSQMGSITDNRSGGYYAYRMSKAALNMFHKSFTMDHPDIISLVLHPGWVRTRMGGRSAPVTPEESAKGLHRILSAATLSQSGAFLNYKGELIPW